MNDDGHVANHLAAVKKHERQGIEPPGAYEDEVGASDPKQAERLGLPRPPAPNAWRSA